MSKPKDVTRADFDAEVLQSDVPVIVDFWAPWCGPCRLMASIMDKVAETYDGRAKVVKVNVDEDASLAGKYGIRSIPTFLMFKGGEQQDMVVGAIPETVLNTKLDKLTG